MRQNKDANEPRAISDWRPARVHYACILCAMAFEPFADGKKSPVMLAMRVILRSINNRMRQNSHANEPLAFRSYSRLARIQTC